MRSAWRFAALVIGLAFRLDRWRATKGLLYGLMMFASTPLLAVASRELIVATDGHDVTRAVALAPLVACAWLAPLAINFTARPLLAELGELSNAAVDEELVWLGAGTPGLGHLENPEHADRLELLRTSAGQLGLGFWFVVASSAAILQLVMIGVLLAIVAPVLLVLPVFALPALVAGRRGQVIAERARRETASSARLARHLLGVAVDAGAAKEIRVYGLANEIRQRQRAAWAETDRLMRRAELRDVSGRMAGQLLFAIAYVGALVLLLDQAIAGDQTVANLVLAILLVSQISTHIQNLVLQGKTLQAAAALVDHLEWLRAAVSMQHTGARGQLPVPARIEHGVVLDRVGFSYPGAHRPALEDVSLTLPAGSVVALVGENGSGKTTLVKLISRFYEPTHGTITLDGIDLRQFDAVAWQQRLTATFQDYARFEVLARETVGVGDIARITDATAVATAVEHAGASDLVARLPAGIETPLGRTWADGAQLSGGQWQKLALARMEMRPDPLILVLDEPSSALDAHSEAQLFERYASSARSAARANGAITLLISHRFSTVRIADLIVVLDGGTITETGTHEDLMTADGLYAELYRLQANAYA